ncbi:DUF551 domain-containing protein [Burkholderia sp. B21-007]|uniref:DUF551 domain-containing protein n=1 Tax=Burkholderia sp. B21-007 TaxID=2890407 RepID=UPI001E5D2726|nr:DUF551 domain-containing protein [Burkholderia sp. B21-007]UEP31570.1 DUF551 domain-containing protein [Burkholderia sp. B21-007]
MTEREEFVNWVATEWRPDDGAELVEKDWPRFAFAAFQAGRRTTPDREAWISVDEQFPEPGACDVLAWNSEGWCAVIHSEYVSPAFPEYTHWMPLPTAPNGEKK